MEDAAAALTFSKTTEMGIWMRKINRRRKLKKLHKRDPWNAKKNQTPPQKSRMVFLK
jgi:hypothetical protein